MQTLELELTTDPPLGATLMLPDAPVAAALLHQGAGVHDRDGNMHAVGFKSTLYRRVARDLASRGIATLRFDKRGSDKARFEPQSYTLPQRVEDARAALELLREQVPDLPYFLIGHSEGALVVAKLAESESVAGVVSLAAPFGNVFELNRYRAKRLTQEGSGPQQARGELAEEYFSKLEALFKESAKLSPEEFVEFAKPYTDAGYAGWESYEWLAGHWAEYLKSEPKKPMLVVQGGRDARLWQDNAERWRKWCEAREWAEFVLIEHMGHDLNDARQKAFRVDDDVIATVAGWLSSDRNDQFPMTNG
jgi:alpha-beta hydrolase superfamily lysophospholipase